MGAQLAVISSKQQRILAGMLEAVGAEGYALASVRSVLGRTGLYRQAFYDHFADKQDCYLQAYDHGVEQIETRVRAAAEGASSWRVGLRAGLGAMLDSLEAEPDVGRALLVEVHAAGPEALAKRDAAVRQFGAYLDQARNDGAGAAPAIAAEAVAAGIHSVLHARLAAREDDGFSRLLPEFMYIAVLPYFGAEAASAEMYGGAI
jgi:AcrR family transcriptional regulator